MKKDLKPSLTKTYRRADGEMVGDEFGWVSSLDHFDYFDYPVELIEETWERTSVWTFWVIPTSLYACEVEDCDGDAVAWEQAADTWRQVCETHQTKNPAKVAVGVTFVRTPKKVHGASCRYATTGAPWEWAEGRPMHEVFWARWNEPCRVCIPEARLIGGVWIVPEPDYG